MGGAEAAPTEGAQASGAEDSTQEGGGGGTTFLAGRQDYCVGDIVKAKSGKGAKHRPVWHQVDSMVCRPPLADHVYIKLLSQAEDEKAPQYKVAKKMVVLVMAAVKKELGDGEGRTPYERQTAALRAPDGDAEVPAEPAEEEKGGAEQTEDDAPLGPPSADSSQLAEDLFGPSLAAGLGGIE